MNILLISPRGFCGDSLAGLLARLNGEPAVLRAADITSAQAHSGTHLNFALVLADIDAEGDSCRAAVRRVVDIFRQCPVVAIGTREDPAFMKQMLSEGLAGYLPKSYSEEMMLAVLRMILGGDAAFEPHAGAGISEVSMPDSDAEGLSGAIEEYRLTRREAEVLGLLAYGLTNRAIANRLKIAEPTTRIYVSAILRKLHVSSRAEAQLVAQRLRMVDGVGGLGDGEHLIDSLLPHMTRRQMAEGEVVFRRGEPGRALFYIFRGGVRLQESQLHLGEGETFGESALFLPAAPRPYSVVCERETELFSLDEAQVRRIQLVNPLFATHVLYLIGRRLALGQGHYRLHAAGDTSSATMESAYASQRIHGDKGH